MSDHIRSTFEGKQRLKQVEGTMPRIPGYHDSATAETPEEKFKRVANLRINNVLKAMDVLGECANRSVYAYSEAQIAKMRAVLLNKVESVIRGFESGKPNSTQIF